MSEMIKVQLYAEEKKTLWNYDLFCFLRMIRCEAVKINQWDWSNGQ